MLSVDSSKLALSTLEALPSWRLPEIPALLGEPVRRLAGAASQISARLEKERPDHRLHLAAAGWLYDLVRSNVKRGRAFELDEVLATGRADCLGYARLFRALGPHFGLELGVVEVLVDNAGRCVPHHAALFSLPDGTYRFLDPWYGSKDISHRRLGALVGGRPQDIGRKDLNHVSRLCGLPEPCIEAIALYIRGNHCLQEGKLDMAIERYSAAIALYPHNSRALYNRALAYERKGETSKARQDYAEAVKDERSLIRIMASTAGLEDLIRLDDAGIGEREQEIYLWHRGYRTGVPVGCEEISLKAGLPAARVSEIVRGVESRCVS